MQIKNISNRSSLDIENCVDEAIHIPGTIQPHGFLIAINKNTSCIDVCSANISDFLSLDIEQILGLHSKIIFAEHSNSLLSSKLTEFEFMNRKFSIQCHDTNHHIVVESEHIDNELNASVDIYSASVQLLHHIENGQNLKELVSAVAKAVRELTQYDRVLIYRFDEEYNGEVIAEAKDDDLESFLGLHYPHTDIPAQARELYLTNQLRVVASVDYQPVPLLTTEESGITQLDLSLSSLRSVSPIHIKYLQNMGVGATLTVSLLHEGKLWGLIACHHRQAKYLTKEMKAAVKLQGHFITSQIDARLKNEENEVSQFTNECVQRLLEKELKLEYSSIETLFTDKAIVDLCNSSGVCAIVNHAIYTYGETPEENDIRRLSAYLQMLAVDGSLYTDRLSTIVNDLQQVTERFPGIIYYSIGSSDDCIIWFRKRTSKEVVWAGEISSNRTKTDKLSPRTSFKRWTQNVENQSRSWLTSELSAVKNFVRYFQLHLNTLALNDEKEAHRKLSEALKKTNAEIEHMDWISNHDIQEPLRKISMMASIIGAEESQNIPDSIKTKIDKIQMSAQRLRDLLKDINKYSSTSKIETNLSYIDLNHLMFDVQDELHSSFEQDSFTLEYDKLPAVNGVSFLLAQVFSNIIQNSIKFQDCKRKLKIKVFSCSVKRIVNKKPTPFTKVSIADNGIGFDSSLSEKVFKLFTRVHESNQFSGTGAGLAICMKIMEKHNGFIEAEAEVGKGVTIHLYFPQ